MLLAADLTKDPPRVPIEKNKRTLLVVDDEPQIRRMMVRLLSGDFNEVLVAATPEEAERHLMLHKVTHLILDYDLGAEHPRGTELVAGWRRRYRSIERVLLITACSLADVEIPAEIDRYFLKGMDSSEIKKALKP